MFKTIVVVDSDHHQLDGEGLMVISFKHYLADYPKANEPKTRVINLCDTEHYLSRGYYCSLLAEAREHRVLPGVGTINDLRHISGQGPSNLAFNAPANLSELVEADNPFELFIFFGWVEQDSWKKQARHLFDTYPAPILYCRIKQDSAGMLLHLEHYAYSKLTALQQQQFIQRLRLFTELVWRKRPSHRRQRWDMAILINPDEINPPSDHEAIKRFIKAAAKVGINAETITAHQSSQIAQYDALFIRETTAIDHHTYYLSRKSEQEGLVVIDDSTSILRCCNKIFLHDAFSYKGVPSPKTKVITDCAKDDLDIIEQEFDYPLVLKMPEGSFSIGVFKINNRKELVQKLTELLNATSLILAQEYLYTDFDWRIGVLNGRAIYACRYHMANNHWQIYNHNSRRYFSGDSETLPTFEVPKVVLDAALKACAIIGRGLYGVDIKQKENHVYVIEVNDNPSIEHKVEDLYLGNELYMLIMSEFVNRLENRGR